MLIVRYSAILNMVDRNCSKSLEKYLFLVEAQRLDLERLAMLEVRLVQTRRNLETDLEVNRDTRTRDYMSSVFRLI